jgi:CDP-paratose 2-epimerase
MKILITGSSGLIGSACVEYFSNLDYQITGLDNNSRAKFFGKEGSVTWNTKKLSKKFKNNFSHLKLDICNKEGVDYLFSKNKFDVILHFAAQPAHDYSFTNPYHDFQVNTIGTVNVLEATRVYNPEATFIFTSTSKVYGVNVNKYIFKELDTRYTYLNPLREGIDESESIDLTLHSMFGANKTAADIICQEYGKYFGLKTTILRPGCLTGKAHSAVELHGFLSYLVKCVLDEKEYKIYDSNGKRVRDNIDSYDIATICHEIIQQPPKGGTVYNVGGCNENSISILEALSLAQKMINKEPKFSFHEPRLGDHIVYISNMTKFKNDYPNWKMRYNLEDIFTNIIEGYKHRDG